MLRTGHRHEILSHSLHRHPALFRRKLHPYLARQIHIVRYQSRPPVILLPESQEILPRLVVHHRRLHNLRTPVLLTETAHLLVAHAREERTVRRRHLHRNHTGLHQPVQKTPRPRYAPSEPARQTAPGGHHLPAPGPHAGRSVGKGTRHQDIQTRLRLREAFSVTEHLLQQTAGDDNLPALMRVIQDLNQSLHKKNN